MRILLALDHSENSAAAIQYLSGLRFTQPVDLQIVTVITPVPLVAFGIPPVIGSTVEDEKEFIKNRLIRISPQFESHFRSVRLVVKVGASGVEIRRLADESQVDLIVMGAVGHSALARMLLGSVSDYVATHANASTLVVRPDEDQPAGTHPTRILLAIGHTKQDQNLVRCLGSLQLSTMTEIHLVHVMELMSFVRQDLLQRIAKLRRELRTSAQTHLESLQRTVREMGYQTQMHVLDETHIGEALIKYAEQNCCDMVMTSDHRHTVLDRLLLGSTSRFVLRHAASSVWIARGMTNEA